MMSRIRFWSIVIVGVMAENIMAQHTVSMVVERPATVENSVYREPLHGGFLRKLPVGQVKPGGWLKEVLTRQRVGLCGQLGTVSAWLDKNNNQWLSDRGDHGWEEVPYWLRGYSSLAYILDDEAMKQEAQVWFDAVLKNMKPNGILEIRHLSHFTYEITNPYSIKLILLSYKPLTTPISIDMAP